MLTKKKNKRQLNKLLLDTANKLQSKGLTSIEKCMSYFQYGDKGNLSLEEFHNSFRNVGINIEAKVIQEIFKLLDEDGNKELSIQEFKDGLSMYFEFNSSADLRPPENIIAYDMEELDQEAD